MSIYPNTNCHTVLEYWNSCDLSPFLYQTGWKQRIFLDCDVVKPTYNIREEASEDGEGNQHITWQREQKVYTMEFLAYEFMLDALYTVSSHDRKWLYLKNGESEEIQDVTIEHEYVSTGVAKVVMTFRTRYILKSACCGNLPLTGCYEVNHTAVIDAIQYSDMKYIDPANNGVLIGHRYIVGGTGNAQNGIFVFTAQGWVLENSSVGDVVYVTAQTANYYFDGNQYAKVMTVVLNSPGISQLRIRGNAYPNSFVRIYYKIFSAGSYTLYPTVLTAAQYKTAGITLTGLASGNDYNVKILSYTHNCNYGESAVSTLEVL